MKNILLAAFVAAGSAAPAMAAPAGQPFLVLEADLAGSALDFFWGSMPSGNVETNLSGRITQSFGWPGAVGQTLSFSVDGSGPSEALSLQIGTESSPGDFFLWLGNVWPGPGVPSPNFLGSGPGPGDVNFSMIVSPNYIETDLGSGLYSYDYTGIFAPFSGRVATLPDFELLLSVYLDGPLPTKTFEYSESEDGPILSIDYVEGPLSISKMTLGLVGGTPVPPAVVPLPAALPLLGAALGGMLLLRRPKRGKAAQG